MPSSAKIEQPKRPPNPTDAQLSLTLTEAVMTKQSTNGAILRLASWLRAGAMIAEREKIELSSFTWLNEEGADGRVRADYLGLALIGKSGNTRTALERIRAVLDDRARKIDESFAAELDLPVRLIVFLEDCGETMNLLPQGAHDYERFRTLATCFERGHYDHLMQ